MRAKIEAVKYPARIPMINGMKKDNLLQQLKILARIEEKKARMLAEIKAKMLAMQNRK